MNDREIVSSIGACLADRIGKDRYEVWFGTSQLAVRGDKLVVSAPDQFFQDWLRSNFRPDLEAAALAAAGRALTIEFRVAAAPPTPAPAATATSSPAAASEAAGSSQSHAAPRCTSAATNGRPTVSLAPRCMRQLASLESFVVGNSNCLAHKAAQMAVEQPGTYSPLVIHGPTGTGKTHLLEGICSAFRRFASAGSHGVSLGRTVHQPVSRGPARQRHAELSPQVSRSRSAGDRRPAVLQRQAGHARRVAAHDRHASPGPAGNWCWPPTGARGAQIAGAGAGRAAFGRHGLPHRAGRLCNAAGHRAANWPAARVWRSCPRSSGVHRRRTSPANRASWPAPSSVSRR